MANLKSDLNLNTDTSEIEKKGKLKLTEEELDNVAGGGVDIAGMRESDTEDKDALINKDKGRGAESPFRKGAADIYDVILEFGYGRTTNEIIEELKPD